ncbi:hypothetical protein [Serratia sp. BIGb0163]|nr:hypothetical protein [Serratia sp. BIGb0163]MCS4266472.1 hypothetical protein [Serratia sp. BIGb0163]
MKPVTSNTFKMLIPHAISDPPLQHNIRRIRFILDNEASEEKKGGSN